MKVKNDFCELNYTLMIEIPVFARLKSSLMAWEQQRLSLPCTIERMAQDFEG